MKEAAYIALFNFHQTARHHISEDRSFHGQSCENLKYYIHFYTATTVLKIIPKMDVSSI
jgi:hypothetical protein